MRPECPVLGLTPPAQFAARHTITHAARSAATDLALDSVTDANMDGFDDASAGAMTVVCIFIASIISNLSPFATLCPTLTDTAAINPGIGAPIWSGSLRSAFLRGSACTNLLVRDVCLARSCHSARR